MKKNLLSSQIEDYISYKRKLGFQIKIESQELRRFATYTVAIGYKDSLSSSIAIKWASLRPDYSRWYMARRLEIVRTFAKYICVFDAMAELPPKAIFGNCHGRTKPYIYTEEEIHILMKSASKLYSPDGLRAIVISTVLGLLWSSGMRPGEACRLKNDDVDLTNGLITIRNTKFSKSRILPIHKTVVIKLSEYLKVRNNFEKSFLENYFFLTTGSRKLTLRKLEYAFQVIRKSLLYETRPGIRRPPRLYDIRHTFASYTLLRWLKEGEDIDNKMLFLSTYLGHVKVSDTYWYLTGTDELLRFATKKFENYFFQNGGESNEKK
jgi:integrase